MHDFNAGVSYIMDPEIGNCTLSSIMHNGYDDKEAGAGVRIRTPKEFFDLDQVC